MSETLTTAEDVIDALGGTEAVRKMTGKSAQLVSYWRRGHGTIPAKYFILMGNELAKQGKCAAPTVWGFEEEAAE